MQNSVPCVFHKKSNDTDHALLNMCGTTGEENYREKQVVAFFFVGSLYMSFLSELLPSRDAQVASKLCDIP